MQNTDASPLPDPKVVVEPVPNHPELMQERDRTTGRVQRWWLSESEIARRFPHLASR